MRLEILPVREREGTRLLPRRRGAMRVVWIVPESNRWVLSGGYMMGSAPTA